MKPCVTICICYPLSQLSNVLSYCKHMQHIRIQIWLVCLIMKNFDKHITVTIDEDKHWIPCIDINKIKVYYINHSVVICSQLIGASTLIIYIYISGIRALTIWRTPISNINTIYLVRLCLAEPCFMYLSYKQNSSKIFHFYSAHCIFR